MNTNYVLKITYLSMPQVHYYIRKIVCGSYIPFLKIKRIIIQINIYPSLYEYIIRLFFITIT